MRPPLSTRKVLRWSAIVLVLLVIAVVVIRSRPPRYSLDLSVTTYSGMAGLHVDYVPGLGGRGACPEAGDAGCIVGYTSLGEDRPTGKDLVPLSIICSQGDRLIYTTKADPREFVIPNLAPGAYTLSFDGKALDRLYVFSNITVFPRQATLTPFQLRPPK
jgi:hypothetical protein